MLYFWDFMTMVQKFRCPTSKNQLVEEQVYFNIIFKWTAFMSCLALQCWETRIVQVFFQKMPQKIFHEKPHSTDLISPHHNGYANH